MASADGKLIAHVFERNCGATTDYSSIVNLQNPSDKFDGNDDVLFVAKGRYDLSVRWMGAKELLVTCPGCLRSNIFRQGTVEGGVDIKYVLGTNQ
jgi:hypothetical protein